MPLPTEKSKAQPRMGKVLIYATPKLGKSTLAATLKPDETLLLDVEDGLSAIEGYKHSIKSWGKVLGVTGEGRNQRPVYDDNSLLGTGRMLATEEHPFTVGVIDTADALAALCSEYVLTQLGANVGSSGFVHASDFDYGKGWSAINAEWSLRIAALARVLPSLILVTHADRRTATTRAGAEYDVFTPTLAPKGVREWTLGFVDHVLFMHMVEGENGDVRAIRTQQNRAWEAGGRTIAGGAKLPDPILLPDAALSGGVLREALELVTGGPADGETFGATASALGNDLADAAVAQAAAPKPKAAAKKKAAKKPPATPENYGRLPESEETIKQQELGT